MQVQKRIMAILCACAQTGGKFEHVYGPLRIPLLDPAATRWYACVEIRDIFIYDRPILAQEHKNYYRAHRNPI